ncbi:hypothetical protein IV203_025284 [Nitzschia inconspicua]|uniref:Glycosyl transferase CAP10 domain-containing protein n=1 Tax=Nitzschia inconspicua TaxID=303405 RepID=A0A9K3P9X6_9STRA|nr:hypothetical protein IV203_024711 [Nitzschia inconspicua]KAG7362400.1 hypothetical protein IV203_025284 [Nitzschia inconspicua]
MSRFLSLLAASSMIAICNLHFLSRSLELPMEIGDLNNQMAEVGEMFRSSTRGSIWATSTSRSVSEVTKQADILRVKKRTFNILCTSTNPYIQFGSYKLRCLDFATWVGQCAGSSVNITTGIEVHEILTHPEIYRQYNFDATIITKSTPNKSRRYGLPSWLGKIYIDVVDNYKIRNWRIHENFTLIFQTERQKEMFPNHEYRVVEHWYNSYPADMERGDALPEFLPTISNRTEISLATIWSLKSFEGGCPDTDGIKDVSYECIVQDFEIEKWYEKVSRIPNSKVEVLNTMSDPKLGPGKLYYNLFRQYDALVALAKNNTHKLLYGNVQRIVSQMRSGVPVLVEVWGPVLQEFVDKYNYTCTFQREHPDLLYMTFQEAVEMMKDPKIRTQCQMEGLEIAKDFSPNQIGKKFLRAVGYDGKFHC